MIWWKGIPYGSIGGLQAKVALLASEVEVLRQTLVPAFLLLQRPPPPRNPHMGTGVRMIMAAFLVVGDRGLIPGRLLGQNALAASLGPSAIARKLLFKETCKSLKSSAE